MKKQTTFNALKNAQNIKEAFEAGDLNSFEQRETRNHIVNKYRQELAEQGSKKALLWAKQRIATAMGYSTKQWQSLV